MIGFTSWLRAQIYGPRPDINERGASEELIEEARTLRSKLEQYQEAPDPLAALMSDIINRREMDK